MSTAVPFPPHFTPPEATTAAAVERALERRRAAVAQLQVEAVATTRAAEILAGRLAGLRAREAATSPAIPFSNSEA